jgi:hypothetical protein
MHNTKAAAPSDAERPRDIERAATGGHAAEPRAAPPQEEARARPSLWSADEEITLDAPVPLSTPSLWPEPDDPAPT